jgi:hypothetical protein
MITESFLMWALSFFFFPSGFSLCQVQFVVDTLCAGVYSLFSKDCGPTAWLACLNLCHSTSMTADDAPDFI